ncbi:hypothetical protein [Streptomyces sp. NPDC012825]|uniref:hypothetical protein n=1 Tax=Streptomyces sp. NPDC012825 TaxID=3364851 RepID=UPI0036AF83FA
MLAHPTGICGTHHRNSRVAVPHHDVHVLAPQDDAAPPPSIAADLTGPALTDSSGINALVLAHRHLSSPHGRLRITGARKTARHVLGQIGVDTAIDHHRGTGPGHLAHNPTRETTDGDGHPGHPGGRPP